MNTVIMPKQGLQMTEGIITRWLKKEGDAVELDEPLFEMETDKLTIEIGASAAGTLLKIVRPEGDTVPITETIAYIGEAGEAIPGSGTVSSAGSAENKTAAVFQVASTTASTSTPAVRRAPGERVFITPRAKSTAVDNNLDFTRVAGHGPDGLIIERDVLDHLAQNPQTDAAANAAALRVTPVAGRLAGAAGLDVTQVSGTGPRGKIMKADVQAAVNAQAPVTVNAQAPVTDGGFAPLIEPAQEPRTLPYSGMRKVIGERMAQSLHEMAQANHRMKVDMTELIRFRESLKANDIKVSYTDILVKIAARALMDFPIVNSSLVGEQIVLHPTANIGLAVALDRGLIVPVVRHAERKSLAQISADAAQLIAKAKNNQLIPDDYNGGTFTITNLGMYDVDEFTAVVNPPESAILAVGKIDRVPVVEDDAVVIRPIMVLSLSYDHRVIDGAPAAQFLQRIKQLMQNPYLLI